METKTRIATGTQCYRQLRRLIMYGQIPASARLGEVEWSRRLGVHRAALREAMALLTHEGLLRRGVRGGFFVPQFSERDVRDIVEARSTIELGALRLIGERRPAAEEFKPLDQLCNSMQQLLAADLVLGFVEADRRFHEALVRLSGNERLTAMFTQAPLPHILPSVSILHITTDVMQFSLKEHRELTDLIREARIAEASSLLETHLSRLMLQYE